MIYNKKYKVNLSTLPEAHSFTKLGVNIVDDDKSEIDFGDSNQQADDIVDKIQSNLILIDILLNLNDKQKVILLYQILRESGYDLTYTECAKTLSITRQRYFFLLKTVKSKAKKVLKQNSK